MISLGQLADRQSSSQFNEINEFTLIYLIGQFKTAKIEIYKYGILLLAKEETTPKWR